MINQRLEPLLDYAIPNKQCSVPFPIQGSHLVQKMTPHGTGWIARLRLDLILTILRACLKIEFLPAIGKFYPVWR